MTSDGLPYQIDVLIFGAGIAGLWMANRLQREGHSVLLIEAHSLGGTQTLASQGVIHGGLKYALNGVLSDSSEKIRDMPDRWRSCLAGEGEVDLQDVKILCPQQVLWSESSLASRLTTFFASKTLASRMRRLDAGEVPTVLQHPSFKCTVYELNELALDVPSLVEKLAAPLQGRMVHVPDPASLRFESTSAGITEVGLMQDGVETVIQPGLVIFAAGAGNQHLMAQVGRSDFPRMQRRPLHQLMLTLPGLPPLYSVCLGSGPKPRLVSTTHYLPNGDTVWYLGGEPAESGVEKSPEVLIEEGKALLHRLLPWVDVSQARWATVRVDRAECLEYNGERPAGVHFSQHGNLIVTWPTKLAMAPVLGDAISPLAQALKTSSASGAKAWPLDLFPAPPKGRTPWEVAFA